MKGYAYLNLDGDIGVKNREYIDTENPLFWQENAEYIQRVWTFDTEDPTSMMRMYSTFRALGLKTDKVKNFSQAIGYSIETLKSYAGNV